MRARSQGKRLGRPSLPADKEAIVRRLLADGTGIVKAARLAGVGVSAVERIKAAMDDTAHAAISAEMAALRDPATAIRADN